ncbi:hypothetical protein KAI46_10965 [bacterium]|nr:hypothetical protein [bacterium]
MKRYVVGKVALQFMLVLAILGLASMAWALRGGPDKFGYCYIDSNDLSGPDYADSYEYGVAVPDNKIYVSDLESNGLGIRKKIGFPFNFYGVDYEDVHVAGNGYLTFSSSDWDNHIYNGESVPSSGSPNNLIAPFWAELESTS